MEWILAHWETLTAIVAALLGAWKARKAGVLNTFLVKAVEGIADPADKQLIKESAAAQGVQKVLSKVVANAGLSSKQKPAGFLGKVIQTVLPLALGAVVLAGCKTVSRVVDTTGKVAHAVADSVEILKGPVEDVGSVWEGAFPPKAPEFNPDGTVKVGP